MIWTCLLLYKQTSLISRTRPTSQFQAASLKWFRVVVALSTLADRCSKGRRALSRVSQVLEETFSSSSSIPHYHQNLLLPPRSTPSRLCRATASIVLLAVQSLSASVFCRHFEQPHIPISSLPPCSCSSAVCSASSYIQ